MTESFYEVRWTARGWGGADADRVRKFSTLDEALTLFDEKGKEGDVVGLHVAEVWIVAGGDNITEGA